MKRSAKPFGLQMNLPLGSVPPAGNLVSQREDLTVALMELLIGAAEEKHQQPGNGGEDVVYVRQSKPSELIHNQESTRLQLSLADRASTLGFQCIVVVDDDLGRTGSGLVDRPGMSVGSRPADFGFLNEPFWRQPNMNLHGRSSSAFTSGGSALMPP